MDKELVKALNLLRDIEKAYVKTRKKIRITVTDDTVEYWGAKTRDAIPREYVYETIGDDDFIDGLNFRLEDGDEKSLAGQWIEKWEVAED